MASLLAMLNEVAGGAVSAGVFGEVRVEEGRGGPRLVCAAPASPEPAEFRVDEQDGRLWVSLVTPARYLSQSIEQDLVHQGDKIEDLLADELIDQESTVGRLPVEHFRSVDRLFTFRSPVPVGVGGVGGADVVLRVLLAYAACFGPLGDLSAGGDE